MRAKLILLIASCLAFAATADEAPLHLGQIGLLVGGSFRSTSIHNFYPELQWVPSWRFAPQWEVLLPTGFLYAQKTSGGNFTALESKATLGFLANEDIRLEAGVGVFKRLGGSLSGEIGGAFGVMLNDPFLDYFVLDSVLLGGNIIFTRVVSTALNAGARVRF